MKKYYLPACLSEEEWEKRDLELYNTDKKEWLASMGVEANGFISLSPHAIEIDIHQNDSVEVIAMKVKHALDGKEFIETEYTRSGQKKLTNPR